MKKVVTFGLVLLLLAPAIFADDAKVMPKLVGRLVIAPNFTLVPGAYDDDKKLQKFDDSLKILNLGFALEFGIINWITAAVQWAPGWTPWSDISPATPISNANTNGVADLFIGAKIQIIGENAPVKKSNIRFAVAPGVLIPLPGFDMKDEFPNMMADKKTTMSNMDNHVWGVGGRFYFDYIVNKNFFINFFNESLFYVSKGDLNEKDFTFNGVKAVGAGAFDGVKGEIDYKYKLTFEIEPVFSIPFGEKLIFMAGLPVNYKFSPAPEYSISGLSEPLLTMFKTGLAQRLNLDPGNSHTLSINPNITFFLTTKLPMEFKLQYNLPVWGMNAQAKHTFMFQYKLYFAFGKR